MAAINAAYYVTSTKCEGLNPQELPDGDEAHVYSTSFECSPVTLAPRPMPPPPRAQLGAEPATVIGGREGCPAVDERGRILVRFHWGHNDPRGDRRLIGTSGECFVQWLERWAGAGYGTSTLPRAGSEVWVEFPRHEGESPIATGQLYSAANQAPFGALAPSEITKVGIRTQTVSWTDETSRGYSEISVDDASFRERVLVRSHRQLDLHAGENAQTFVGRDSAELVKGNAEIRVDGTFRQAAGRDLGFGAERDRSVSVGRNDSESVVGTKLSVVTGERVERTHGDVFVVAMADHDVSVRQSRRASIAGDDRVEVSGAQTLIVKRKFYENIGESRVTTIGAHGTDDARSDLTVWGDLNRTASGTLSLNAGKGIVITCGNSSIELKPDGITLRGDSLQLVGTTLTLKAKDLSLGASNGATLASQQVTLQASGSQLQLASSASLTGGSVSIGSGSGSNSSGSSGSTNAQTQKVSLALKNALGRGIAKKKYAFLFAGKKVEGTTDADGIIDAELPQDVVEAALTVWTDTYPDGPTRQYVVEIGTLPPASDPKGAQIRLTHLGYYGGAITGTLDRQTVAALVKFQADRSADGLRVTGSLDAATQSQLQKIHGS